MKVYTVVVEDASHLGGPMGSEYTTHVLSKTFSSLEKAKAFGLTRGHGDDTKWHSDGRRRWSIDRLSEIITITEEEMT